MLPSPLQRAFAGPTDSRQMQRWPFDELWRTVTESRGEHKPDFVHLRDFEPPRPPRTLMVESDGQGPDRQHDRLKRLLFMAPTSAPLYRGAWSHIWWPAQEMAGVPRGIGLHCLRHYFTTLLIHNGASVKAVQLALWHSTPTVTLNTYVGEWPEAHEKTRALVAVALGRVPQICPPEAVDQ